MPLEVVVELQIRAISCPGVFLPDKQDVYLGVYLLNQYLETDCFPSVFPIMIQQRMVFEKLFENAIDPGAVADILESFVTRFELIQLVPPGVSYGQVRLKEQKIRNILLKTNHIHRDQGSAGTTAGLLHGAIVIMAVWEELAYYEENTREFLFPEPKLTPSNLGMCREVLMKTAVGFPGIAPKIEFSTRTAIREIVLLHRNRFLEERYKSRRPLSTSYGTKCPLNNKHVKPRESNLNRLPRSMPSRTPSPYSARRFFQNQPAQSNLGNNFRISRESKPPFVVRHVDGAKPFGENISEHHSLKSRKKSKFSGFPFPMQRASSLDSLAANVKVIKEPDELIVLRNESPSPLDSSKFRKPSPSSGKQGDADLHLETSLTTSRHSRSPGPLLDQPLLQQRFHPGSQSPWKETHKRSCSLLTSHRAQQHPNKEDFISKVSYILERPSYPLKNYPVYEQRYF